MAGSVAAGGNATAAAEANVAHDPGALAVLVGADWAVPPVLIGLDATHEATLSAAEIALCSERRTAAATFCDGPLRFYRNVVGGPTGDCACHDLLAVLALVDRSIVRAAVLPVTVDLGRGPAWGATVVDRRGRGVDDGFAPWCVALGADAGRFRAAARTLFGG
jgi:purine nucleosidase